MPMPTSSAPSPPATLTPPSSLIAASTSDHLLLRVALLECPSQIHLMSHTYLTIQYYSKPTPYQVYNPFTFSYILQDERCSVRRTTSHQTATNTDRQAAFMRSHPFIAAVNIYSSLHSEGIYLELVWRCRTTAKDAR